MKILDVRTRILSQQIPQLFNSMNSSSARTCLVVEIHTDEGLTGIGEAACYGYPEIVEGIINRISKPLLVGKDPFQIERLWATQRRKMGESRSRGYAMLAMSGIDIALWDLLGKTVGMPIYRLLGGFTDKIMAYATAGFYAIGKGIPDLKDEYRNFVAKGFRMMKMKVGRQGSDLWPESKLSCVTLREDIERVAAVREVIGPERTLMVDANCAWDPATAIKMGREFEKYNVYFLEEPVSPTDVAGSALVAASLDMHVAGYETEVTLHGFRDLIVHRAVDVVQPDVIVSGGFTGCRKIAAIAEAHNMSCIPHSFASGISLVANAHFLASLPLGGPLEFKQVVPDALFFDLLLEPPTIDAEGFFHLPSKPGLGIELNPDTMAKYNVG
jgi:L-alanine-DL-glutamate epimerase-like enolase superfamily enzyme